MDAADVSQKTTSKFTHYYYFKERFVNVIAGVSLSQGCECSSDHSGHGQVQHFPQSPRGPQEPRAQAQQSSSSLLRRCSLVFVGVLVILSPVFYFEKNYQNHATTTWLVCETGRQECVPGVGGGGRRRGCGQLHAAVLLQPLTASLVHLDE